MKVERLLLTNRCRHDDTHHRAHQCPFEDEPGPNTHRRSRTEAS